MLDVEVCCLRRTRVRAQPTSFDKKLGFTRTSYEPPPDVIPFQDKRYATSRKAMHMLENILLRKALATFVFGMAFLLTPRVWVEEGRSVQESETIPVRMLERPDQEAPCLWCSPAKPVDCDVEVEGELDIQGDNPSQSSSDRLWLNPDEPPPKSEDTPCIKAQPADAAPSA